MDTIHIEGTPKTPTINFNPENGLLEIQGRSIPENAVDFYKPVVDWLTEYAQSPVGQTVMNIQLEYFNTSSSKCILDVLKKLEVINNQSSGSVKVRWHYEEDDEDMLEAGEDYEAIIDVSFEMIEVEEE
ncbi:MAG: DUF1987 domain-containing protein [Salibacteraceae bacterium]